MGASLHRRLRRQLSLLRPSGSGSPGTEIAGLDSCALSDALDRAGLPGAVAGLRPLTAHRRIAGPVITVGLAPPGRAGAVRARHLGTAAVEAARPGDIIVVTAGGRTGAAGWGGVLSVAAAARGAAGVIVDGACRDVDEARELGFPVYARAAVPRTARGRLAEVSWNEPVQIAGVPVSPGDWAVADGSGVVFVPSARVREVIAAAREIAGREAAMVRRIRAGEPVSQVLSAAYENMLTPGGAAGKAPDGKAPDGKAPDGKAPDGKAPDGKAPDGKAPDGKAGPARDR